jgi:hypothetical protein
MRPEGKLLDIMWADGQATVAVPQLDLYSILMVDLGHRLWTGLRTGPSARPQVSHDFW